MPHTEMDKTGKELIGGGREGELGLGRVSMLHLGWPSETISCRGDVCG